MRPADVEPSQGTGEIPRIPADRVGLTCGQGTRRVRANVTPGAPRTGLTLTPLS